MENDIFRIDNSFINTLLNVLNLKIREYNLTKMFTIKVKDGHEAP